jgi:hypothetical protein
MIRCHIFDSSSSVGRVNSLCLGRIKDILEALYQRLMPYSDKALR